MGEVVYSLKINSWNISRQNMYIKHSGYHHGDEIDNQGSNPEQGCFCFIPYFGKA